MRYDTLRKREKIRKREKNKLIFFFVKYELKNIYNIY